MSGPGPMTGSDGPAGSVASEPQALPTWRDPWAWVSAASVLLLFARTRGAPRGEPVAEDFDFLHRALLEPSNSLLDGGGSSAFWRPISFQLYYGAFGPLMLSHPRLVSAIHGALLALGALLLYRVLRRSWSGPAAATAASFPLLAESTRTLACWSGQFADVSSFVFLAVAVHEAAFRRPWTSYPALLAALLSKELAVVGALLIPFLPTAPTDRRPSRVPWLVGAGVVAALWAIAYAWVRRHTGLEMPHALERDPAILATPLHARVAWAIWNSLRATFSLSLTRGPWDGLAGAACGVLALAAVVALLRDAGARARVAAARGWIAWGFAWALLSWASLAPIFPLWASNRSQLGSLGFGVAAVAFTGAAHPWLAAGLVTVRLGLLALAPGTPDRILRVPEERGAFMDYSRLCRLQMLMSATRGRLLGSHPSLPHGAIVGQHNLPLSTEYAFGGPFAVQAWYRDTTLRWMTYKSFQKDPARPVVTFISYQPDRVPAVALLDPDALRWQIAGLDHYRAGRWRAAIDALLRSDSLESDPGAVVFRGDNAGRRSYCWAQLARWPEAEAEASVAVRAATEDVGARYVLALVRAVRHQRREALAELDTLLALKPDHEEALELKRVLERPSPPPNP